MMRLSLYKRLNVIRGDGFFIALFIIFLRMTKYFNTEIRESFKNKYVKVFLLNMQDSDKIKSWLESIPAVKKVNISNDGKDLTVYPSALVEANEAEEAIIASLHNFYSSSKECLGELENTKTSLGTHEKTKKLYDDAISNIKSNGSSRITLDSLRLALEKLLQDILGNESVLEKQKKPLGNFLKSKGVTPEIRNSIITSLDAMYHFQDNYVKHDDNVKDNEVDYIANTTNNIVNQIIKYEKY